MSHAIIQNIMYSDLSSKKYGKMNHNNGRVNSDAKNQIKKILFLDVSLLFRNDFKIISNIIGSSKTV